MIVELKFVCSVVRAFDTDLHLGYVMSFSDRFRER